MAAMQYLKLGQAMMLHEAHKSRTCEEEEDHTGRIRRWGESVAAGCFEMASMEVLRKGVSAMPEASEPLAGGRASLASEHPRFAPTKFQRSSHPERVPESSPLRGMVCYGRSASSTPSGSGFFLQRLPGVVARSSLNPRLMAWMPPASNQNTLFGEPVARKLPFAAGVRRSSEQRAVPWLTPPSSGVLLMPRARH